MKVQEKNTGGRILIIDDDPDIRMMVQNLLRKQGYEVETASRMEEAFEQIASFAPSLILLDVLLSGNDGRNICREIKANGQTSHIPVIMVSAHPSAAEKIQEYGADDFLGKPFNSDVLLQKVQRCLGEGTSIVSS
jgi:DNA-binding response OmpR family regulator